MAVGRAFARYDKAVERVLCKAVWMQIRREGAGLAHLRGVLWFDGVEIRAVTAKRFAKDFWLQGRSGRRLPTIALLAVSIVLPLLLFGLAAWQNRRDVVREADTRVERTTRILHEHAIKVFEMHELMIAHINERLKQIDWANPAEVAALHRLLGRLQRDAKQVAEISITDAEGAVRVSSRAGPPGPASLADTDYFKALKARADPLPYVGKAVVDRVSGELVFDVAQRVGGPTSGRFEGVIAIAVRRAYFEDFYRDIARDDDHLVVLMRDDGSVLADEPRSGLTAKPIADAFAQGLDDRPNGFILTNAMIGGTDRIFGFESIDAYPVLIGFGVSWHSALAPWWRNLLAYGFVAFLSSLALLAASGLALRHSALEARATQRWRDTAALLQREMAERLRVEEQLRQAQKMEAVGRLTGGIAHDFNNLLTIVIGSLDLLSRRSKDEEPRQQALIRNAIDGANRAATLTARLLSFSRQQPLDPKPLDVNGLVQGMSGLMQRSLGETVEVELILADALWTTFVDPNQLESALLNLAVNALDAMPQGGRLTIETENAVLDEAYVAEHNDVVAGDYVAIIVRDTGTGMTPDVLSHAFDPFYTTKPVGKGTGLGLSQVYGFTKQSGGHAVIYSELGHGTAIKLYLPRHVGETVCADGAETPTVDGVALRPGEATILIVEDEELLRHFSSTALRESGYKVLEAASALEGLDRLRQHPEITLLFTDVVLGAGMNGRELADRAAMLRPGLPILFTTGYTKTTAAQHGRLDDGVNFLGKPFTTAALAAKIEALLPAAP